MTQLGGSTDVYQDVDVGILRSYRLDRVRRELKKADFAAALLYDPVNIRYASDSRNMQVWTLHAPARYLFVASDGPVILFDYHGCIHLSETLETIDEIRPAISWMHFSAGPRVPEKAKLWAREIADLVGTYGGRNRQIAVDRCEPAGLFCLKDMGIDVHDAQPLMELARAIKNPQEIQCMRIALNACETAVGAMQKAMKPGLTEQEIWSHMHQSYISVGGEWIETRLASSGPNTNPWFQECGGRRVEKGDLFSFDTDMVGPTGYFADISRTWVVGDERPSDEQRKLYSLAHEQIRFNTELVRPGLSFREFTERAWRMPEQYVENRYSIIAHGVGLCDEYPAIYYPEDWEDAGYDGMLEENMTICIESYIGEAGGVEGVKLEQQVMVTKEGCEVLSNFPFDERFFLREI